MPNKTVSRFAASLLALAAGLAPTAAAAQTEPPFDLSVEVPKLQSGKRTLHDVSIIEFRTSLPNQGHCDHLHLHAFEGNSVTAVDGTVIFDPDEFRCGFGVVSRKFAGSFEQPVSLQPELRADRGDHFGGHSDAFFEGIEDPAKPVIVLRMLGTGPILSLGGSRFEVRVDWQTVTESGQGTAVQLTEDTGYFWFFNENNVEMTVKVLDACAINDRFWVFAGGLTSVAVTMTITDTETGASKVYLNPQGAPFQPIQDTGAFATCP